MNLHLSTFGLIPKKSKPGKQRLIVDLAAPEGRSVNDGIERDMISLSYTPVDAIVDRAIQLGQGTPDRHTDSFLSIQMTDICWAWSGRVQST